MIKIKQIKNQEAHDSLLPQGLSPSGENLKGLEMTTEMLVEIDNLKCGGCEKSILKGLASIAGVSNVSVDIEHNRVGFTGDTSVRDSVVNKLSAMGYPEKDSLSGLNAGLATVKSFVSCAIGRVS
ncbi:MAG: heavy metal-associated domain-containing protein [Burkholderiaceae bacterium]